MKLKLNRFFIPPPPLTQIYNWWMRFLIYTNERVPFNGTHAGA